jgi:hypothetical protein
MSDDTPASPRLSCRILIRRWIAILCVSLFVFTGIAHSTSIHFTVEPTKVVSVDGADAGDNSDDPSHAGAAHCHACAVVSLANAEPVLVHSSAAGPLIWANHPALRSNHRLFDTPPPKSLT